MRERICGPNGSGHERRAASHPVREGEPELAAVERARRPRLPHDEGARRARPRRVAGDRGRTDAGGAPRLEPGLAASVAGPGSDTTRATIVAPSTAFRGLLRRSPVARRLARIGPRRERYDAVVVVARHLLPLFAAVRGPLRVWYPADDPAWHHLTRLRLRERRTWGEARLAAVNALYERAFRPLFDRVWVVSRPDRTACRLLSGRQVDLIPNGVDADHYAPGPGGDIPDSCVFWGRLDFGPNEDALAWFLADVWPGVRAAVPGARFDVFGFNPTDRVRRLAESGGASLHADLPDLRGEVRRRQAVVLPFVSGGGIKNKLLEAAAMGLPVVCTRWALSGTKGRRRWRVARTPREWADALARLWSDAAARADARRGGAAVGDAAPHVGRRRRDGGGGDPQGQTRRVGFESEGRRESDETVPLHGRHGVPRHGRVVPPGPRVRVLRVLHVRGGPAGGPLGLGLARRLPLVVHGRRRHHRRHRGLADSASSSRRSRPPGRGTATSGTPARTTCSWSSWPGSASRTRRRSTPSSRSTRSSSTSRSSSCSWPPRSPCGPSATCGWSTSWSPSARSTSPTR